MVTPGLPKHNFWYRRQQSQDILAAPHHTHLTADIFTLVPRLASSQLNGRGAKQVFDPTCYCRPFNRHHLQVSGGYYTPCKPCLGNEPRFEAETPRRSALLTLVHTSLRDSAQGLHSCYTAKLFTEAGRLSFCRFQRIKSAVI